jgi:hypothetical protein
MDNYFESWKELEGKLGDKPKFYNFDYDELSSTYEQFHNYAFQNLKNVWDDYLMSKCYFYFYQKTDNFREPAYAMRVKADGTYVVGISRELIEYLAKTFLPYTEARISIAKLNGSTFTHGLAESLGTTLLYFALQFLFHHEVGHIMQFDGQNLQYQGEGYADGDIGDYEEMSHITERDADALAANYLVRIVLGMWGIDENNKKTKNLPVELLEALMAIMISSVFVLFDHFSHGMKRPFYTFKGTHPHPAIRMSDFLATTTQLLVMLNVAPVSEMSIIQGTVDLLDQLGKGDFSRQWNKLAHEKHSEFYTYKRTIRVKSEQYEWLCTPVMTKFVEDQKRKMYHYYSIKCWLSKEEYLEANSTPGPKPAFTKSLRTRIPLLVGKKIGIDQSDNSFPNYPYIVDRLAPHEDTIIAYTYFAG